MSRAELHGIVANLRAYLEWHSATEPGLGVPPAPAELLEAFGKRVQDREAAKLAAARNALTQDAPAPATSQPEPVAAVESPTRPTFESEPQAEPAQRPATQSDTAASGAEANKPWVKYGPRSRKTFGADAKKPAPAAPTAAAAASASDDGPPPADYDGPPLEEPPFTDESYGHDEPAGPAQFDYPPHGAGNLARFDANRFGWQGGKFRSPPEPDGGFGAADKLAILRMYLGDCSRCGLCEGRTNIVFGDGSPSARLMFVGEGPGYNEDQQARPFVGKAGQLLDKMIGAMGFDRDQVYIANVVKCRPPDNRDPAPDEVVACSPFLHKQIDAIKPDVIVTLGRFAAHNLLSIDTPISRMRGQWHEFKGIPVMPTWHPAYLLRNEGEKRNAWADLQQVMEKLKTVQ